MFGTVSFPEFCDYFSLAVVEHFLSCSQGKNCHIKDNKKNKLF